VVHTETLPSSSTAGAPDAGTEGLELVRIDDQEELSYDSFAAALNAGVARASHDLVVVLREGISLGEGWRKRLDGLLDVIEQEDHSWGVAAGRSRPGGGPGGRSGGHDQSLHAPRAATPEEILRIDERALVLRRSSGLRFDQDLPSADHCGKDLALTAHERGLGVHVLDAPIVEPSSPPAREPTQEDLTRLAEMACADAYFVDKWPEARTGAATEGEASLDGLSTPVLEYLDQPVVLLARGGSGSRLLSTLASDCGIFVGTDLNVSGDCLEMVPAIYQGVLEKYRSRVMRERRKIVPRLRRLAAAMLRRAGHASLWGFKLPESMLLLPEIDEAFPRARYVHLLRDPLTTCLRRTHQTARLDNAIGRTAIRAAYRHCGLDPRAALDDDPLVRMAVTTRHQIETVLSHARSALAGRCFELRFEHLLAAPGEARASVAAWLGVEASGRTLEPTVDTGRAARPTATYTAEVAANVSRRLAPLRAALGYTH
jgi:hypothetical protein